MSRLIRGEDAAARVVAWRAPEVPGAGAYRRTPEGDPAAVQQRAWDQGFEQGRAAGLEAGSREVAARIEALEGVLDALARPLEDLDHRVEAELLALVQAIVRQLIRREVHQDPGHIVGVIREALTALPLGGGDVTVRLHPDDAGTVHAFLSEAPAERAWRVEADPLLERGGCLVTSPRSTVDARLDTRLARVVAGLLEDERADAG